MLAEMVRGAREGDLDAYGEAVRATEAMVQAVAFSVLRDASLAQDAAQEAYLTAFRRLGGLEDPAAFPGWLRRITLTSALNMRRGTPRHAAAPR